MFDPHHKHLHNKKSDLIMSKRVIMQTFAGRKGLLVFLAKLHIFSKQPSHVDRSFNAGDLPS
jgi:hypothetical protein